MNNTIKTVIIVLLSFGASAGAQSLEERVTNLEKSVNEIIKNEQSRSEAINKLADSIMKLEAKSFPKTPQPMAGDVDISDETEDLELD